QAHAEQEAEHHRLAAEVAAAYVGRDRAWWAARFAGPLKVLVPTSRFSTYIQHASRDLVSALRRAGHRAELLIQPDDSSLIWSVGYLRALRDFEPDLILSINSPRVSMGAWIPHNLPLVCWIQDAMPHQFDGAVGAAHGRFDFLA